jgi:hypothetical protein
MDWSLCQSKAKSETLKAIKSHDYLPLHEFAA